MYGGSTKKTKEKRYVIESDTQDRTYDVKVSKQNGEKKWFQIQLPINLFIGT